MQFSDTTNKTGLVEDTDFWAGTDSTSYPLVDKARNINRHYYVVVADIERVAGRSQRSDSNLASLPYVDLTMVEGTHQVALPEANSKIHAVEVKDDLGNYVRIREVDFSDKPTTISSRTTTSGFPTEYDVIGSWLYLDPPPTSTEVTLNSGLRVWTSPEIDAFVSTDTNQEPGFAEPFHRILSLGAAHDYLVINGPPEKADRVLQKYELLREELRNFYADKNRDTRIRIRPAHNTKLYQ